MYINTCAKVQEPKPLHPEAIVSGRQDDYCTTIEMISYLGATLEEAYLKRDNFFS
jgi:hypothetical protein